MAEGKKTEMKKEWLAVIHVAATQLGLADEEYRNVLTDRYGVNSAKDLTPAQGQDLIDHFRGLGFVPARRARVCKRCLRPPRRDAIPANVIYPASSAQIAQIRQLKNDIKWWSPDGFYGWLKRYFKIGKIQTSAEASSVIYALLRLWRSQNGCRCSLVRGD